MCRKVCQLPFNKNIERFWLVQKYQKIVVDIVFKWCNILQNQTIKELE